MPRTAQTGTSKMRILIVLIERIVRCVLCSLNIVSLYFPEEAKGTPAGSVFDGGIAVLQISLHHFEETNDAMCTYVVRNKIYLVMCQDPYVVDGVISGVPINWPFFLSSNNNAAILLTNKDYAAISSQKLDNSVTISLNVCGDIIYLCSQYSSPTGNIDNDLSDLGDHFQQFNKVLIAGDFNVPLLDFGYTRQTERSDVFLEHIMDKDLRILNDPDATHTFVQGSLKGRPDLNLGGVEICAKIDNWSVDDENFSFSDNLYIRFKLNYIPERKQNISYKTKRKSFQSFNKKDQRNRKEYAG